MISKERKWYKFFIKMAINFSVIIQYKSPVKISLPLNESLDHHKYILKWGEKWLIIGSGDCYISNE